MHIFYSKQMDRQYQLVSIKQPLNFPKDRNIFLHFRLDAKKISKRADITLGGNTPTLFTVEHVDLSKEYLFIEGWAFLKGELCQAEVFVVLQSDRETLAFDTSRLFRRDLGLRFNSVQLDNNGFLATVKTAELIPGRYRIGLQVKQNDRQGFILTERVVRIP
jgi:hypothetical protein